MIQRQSVEQMLGPQANFQKVELVFSNDDLGIKFQSDLNQLEGKDQDYLNSQIHQDKFKATQIQLDNTTFFNKTMEQSIANLQLQKLMTNNLFNNSDTDQLKSLTQRAQNNDEQTSSNILYNLEQKKHSMTQSLIRNKEKEQTQIPKQQHDEYIQSPIINKQKQNNQFSCEKQKMKARNDEILKKNFMMNSKKNIMYFLQKLTPFGRNRYFKSKRIVKIIGDKSYVIQKNAFTEGEHSIKSLFCRTVAKIIQLLNSRSLLINPINQFYLAILSVFSCFNVVFYIILSIYLVFIQSQELEINYQRSVCILWLLEIILHLNTQIFDSSKLITNRIQIFSIYIKKRAIFDFIPLIILLNSGSSLEGQKIYLIFSFIKLKNTLSDLESIQKTLKIFFQKQHILMLFELIFNIFIFSHLIACFWYLIGQIEINLLNLNKTWYSHLDSDDLTWWNIYLDSFNWSITVLVTGQNTVSSPLQRLFANFIMMFAVLFFGYILNQIHEIINLYQQDSKQLSECNTKINNYMNKIKTSSLIQMKANIQLENFHQYFQNKNSEEAQSILKQISPETYKTIKIEYLQNILKKIDFLNQNFSKQTLFELAETIQEDFYGMGQTIISQREQSQASLIYVVEGELQVFQHFQKNEQNQIPIQILKNGDLFGKYNFFSGQIGQISVKTKIPTKIIKINRDKFIEIVKNKEGDYEVFCDLKDRITLSENYELIGENCIFCQSNFHLQIECPVIHLPKKLIYYTSKFAQNVEQSRQTQERKKNKQNPLYSFKQNKMIAKKFIRNFRIQLKENNDMKRNINLCLLYNLSSEDISSEENDNMSASAKESSFQEESKDDNQKLQQRLSSKRISSNVQENANHKTQNIIPTSQQQMDTMIIDSLLNNVEEFKIISQKSAQTIQYSSKYQLGTQSQKNRLSTSQFLIEDEISNKKNTNVLLPNSTSFFNNLDPEFKSEAPLTTSLGTKYTKQQTSIAEFSNGRTKSLDRNENEKAQQYDLDLNSISKYLKAKKSVFFSQQDNNSDFDKYQRYQKKLYYQHRYKL
ncbi:cyclic nucleotide-binding domain protein (macronuclear) [Tetrahymena thermophila SB210]|uniref:Cyclic nucleotide-binding domain protein n=1 Tax=Tetrahymena thermophila (strain SB210) TaxID=312017 RepID=Q23GD2_TETTS|nr:cyclic nucleotide-binding domain protein [Tetrahymena thermophila SB210]EAR95328.2 cyclic nucleotide-binding domain protein [Tetrahymena thermophila SB210]|eukprot:XP_001015573.2 cyclic nucleotide-binding domain protein [Tetrahymena thermophila SB210]